MLNYLGSFNSEHIHWQLIKSALASVAHTVLIPLQDVLGLTDEEGRMNTPGKAEGNWSWRFGPEEITDQLVTSLAHLTVLYGRA